MTAKRKTAKKTSKKKVAARKKATTGSKAKKKAATKKTVTKKAASKKKVAKKKTAKKAVTKKTAKKKVVAKKATKKKAVAKKVAKKKAASKAAPKKRVAAPPKPKLNLRKFREQLKKKHQDLMQAYLAAKGDTRQRESDGTEDYIDYAVNSYDREFLLSLTELEQSQLDLIEEALKRIEDREYGSCVQCERPIPVKRLEVQPWARYCVRCQELADQGLVAGTSEFPDVDDFEPIDREVEEVEREG